MCQAVRVKELQEATDSEKAAIIRTEIIEENKVYLTDQVYNIWDFSGQKPSQIIEILLRLENNTCIIPLFVVDICPPAEDLENERIPATASLSIRDDIVQKRIAQQQAEFSDAFCQTILASISNLSKIKVIGYLVNKVDLLDQDSKKNIFRSELPALRYLEEQSKAADFILKKQAGSALDGSNVRKIFREIASSLELK